MRKRYLECGKIVSTHGIRGEVKVQHWCDGPEYLTEFSTLYLDKGEIPMAVEKARTNKDMVLIKFRGVDDMDTAGTFRGKILYLDREDAPEDDGVFLQDMLGLEVFDIDTGVCYGKLTDVLHTGANDVYEITDDEKKKRLIPAIPPVVLGMDLEAGRMEIRPLEGLFDDEN
ncbi:ribosome maturation factor RimM [Ruminococcaceae bacterium OttesenSCG-928-L11]|nr:ribosome maturation factor RimM [Ruminococcaceae bacterium OttesenSCG-928-L11]